MASSLYPTPLNASDCLSLESITQSFSAPITEEHAFAVIYECIKTLAAVTSTPASASKTTHTKTSKPQMRLAVVGTAADIMIHKEGRVHESTFVGNSRAEDDDEHDGAKADIDSASGRHC